jgi:hypothetical protein
MRKVECKGSFSPTHSKVCGDRKEDPRGRSMNPDITDYNKVMSGI